MVLQRVANRASNYDLHWDDILAADREPWLMLDPKPLAGDPAFSLAQLIWTRYHDFAAGPGLATPFAQLVACAGVDLERARRWTLIRCLDYGLWSLSVGLSEDPRRCAAVLAALATPAES